MPIVFVHYFAEVVGKENVFPALNYLPKLRFP